MQDDPSQIMAKFEQTVQHVRYVKLYDEDLLDHIKQNYYILNTSSVSAIQTSVENGAA